MWKKLLLPAVWVVCLTCMITRPGFAQSAGPVPVSLPAATGVSGAILTIPITVGDVTGAGVTSFGTDIAFNASVVRILGASSVGTLSSGFTIVANPIDAGTLRVGGFGLNPLEGDGTLVNLEVELLASGISSLGFSSFEFNGGMPATELTSGSIHVETQASNAIEVDFEAASGLAGTTLRIPLTTADVSGQEVVSFEAEITFNTAFIQVDGVSTGPMSSSWELVSNVTRPGTLRVGGIGTTPLSGSGTLFFLDVTLLAEGATTLGLQQFAFNDGQPEVSATGGTVSILNGLSLDVNAGLQVPEGSTATIGSGALKATAGGADASLQEFQLVSVPSEGQLLLSGNGLSVGQTLTQDDIDQARVAYAHSGSETTADGFDFVVSSALAPGVSVSGTFDIVVQPTNDPPTAVDDSGTTGEAVPVTINVLANDSDVEGDDLVLVQVNAPANGTAVIVDGSVQYTPGDGFSGTDTFTYVVSDGQGASATGLVTVTVSANKAPTVVDDAFETDEDVRLDINVATLLANDSDPDPDDVISVTAVGTPSNGTATNVDGQITYTPNPDFNGVDTFSYTISDVGGLTDTGEVTVTVNSVNDDPVAADDASPAVAGQMRVIPVLKNDSDADSDALTVSITVQPAGGTAEVSMEHGTVRYTPREDFTGADSFTYEISDGNGGSATATVTLTVTAAPVDDDGIDETTEAGVPNPDGGGTGDGNGDGIPDNEQANVASLPNVATGAFVTVSVPDGTELVDVQSTENPAPSGTELPEAAEFPIGFVQYGVRGLSEGAATTVTLNLEDGIDANSYWKYGPTPDNTEPHWYNFAYDGETGAQIFPAERRIVLHFVDGKRGDDDLTANGVIDDPGAPVKISNSSPLAVLDAVSTNEDTNLLIDVLANDSDADGDAITIVSVTQPTSGTVTVGTGGTLTYAPSADFFGQDTFTYTIQDAKGAETTGNVTVSVAAVNDAPVAVADAASVEEDHEVSVNVLANDTDVDSDVLTVAVATQPANGTLTLDGGTFTYVPAANFHGEDTFIYTVSDSDGAEATGTVTVTVESVNDLPVVVNDQFSTMMNTARELDVLANDSDVDGDVLTIISATGAVDGEVTIAADGRSLTYTPFEGATGWDRFDYTVSDGQGGEVSSAVVIQIVAVNSAPVAEADAFNVDTGKGTVLDVLANDMDAEGDSVFVSAVGEASNGQVTLDGGVVTYTPGADFTGTDTFTYTLSDAAGNTASGSVTVTVAFINDPPVFAGGDAGGTTVPAGAAFVSDGVFVESDGVIQVPFAAAEDEEDVDLVYSLSVYASADTMGATPLLNKVVTAPAAELTFSDVQMLFASQPVNEGDTLFVYFALQAVDSGDLGVAAALVRIGFVNAVGVATEEEAGIPTEFRLRSAYPNPFASRTTIPIDVPEASHVSVRVFDALGRTVATLMDAPRAPGTYRVHLNGERLSGGTYFLVLEAGAHRTVQSVVLVR